MDIVRVCVYVYVCFAISFRYAKCSIDCFACWIQHSGLTKLCLYIWICTYIHTYIHNSVRITGCCIWHGVYCFCLIFNNIYNLNIYIYGYTAIYVHSCMRNDIRHTNGMEMFKNSKSQSCERPKERGWSLSVRYFSTTSLHIHTYTLSIACSEWLRCPRVYKYLLIWIRFLNLYISNVLSCFSLFDIRYSLLLSLAPLSVCICVCFPESL